jgi:hypothetical protein
MVPLQYMRCEQNYNYTLIIKHFILYNYTVCSSHPNLNPDLMLESMYPNVRTGINLNTFFEWMVLQIVKIY